MPYVGTWSYIWKPLLLVIWGKRDEREQQGRGEGKGSGEAGYRFKVITKKIRWWRTI